jgi:hypothetical protein
MTAAEFMQRIAAGGAAAICKRDEIVGGEK